MRVLVVDDEPYITDVVSSALAFEGFATQEASTAVDALTQLRTKDEVARLRGVTL